MNRLRAYLSVSGSFSRMELLIAGFVLLACFSILVVIQHHFPAVITPGISGIIVLVLYVAWGIALGKRSRDLGTTFTYGMILGMLIPLIGVLFLFQAGKKEKLPVQMAVNPPPLGNPPHL